MANTIVGFTIEIDGIQSINQLNEGIKDTKKAMNDLDLSTEAGQKQFEELSQTLGKMTAQQKALRKAQDDVNKSFLPEKAIGAYDKASAELNKLRKEFKNAALDGSKTTAELDKMQKEIQQLDQTLKKVDGQVGQFQRNVGNYPKTFQRITRSLNQAIPGFEAFSSTLKNSEGRLTSFGVALVAGFVAFQAANLINRAITNLEEFNKKVIETRNTVMEFSGLYGESLDRVSAQTTALAETFGTDAKTISEAAKALSKQLGIGFEEAITKLEGALVEGRGNADDYLQKIKEMPSAFVEAGDSVSELSVNNRKLLESNKTLAASQIDTAKRSKELVSSFKEFKNAAGSALINVLLALYEAFKPIGTAFYNLGKAVFGFINALVSVFAPAGRTTSLLDLLASAIQFLLSPITFLIQLTTSIYQTMTRWAPVIAAVSVAIGVFTIAMNAARIAAAFAAIAQGAYSAALGVYTTVINVAKAAQQAFNNAVRSNPLGLALTGIIAAGTAIAAYTAVTDESTAAIDDQTEAQKRAEAEMKAKMDLEEKAIADKMEKQRLEFEEQAKIEEAKRKAEEAAQEYQRKINERVEKLTSERISFLEKEVEATKNALSVIADLRAKYIDEQIKNIKDSRERQIREVERGAEKEALALDEQFKKFQEDNKKRAAEAEKQAEEARALYGANSEKAKKIEAENKAALDRAKEEETKVAAEISAIKIEITKRTNTETDKLNSEFRQEDLDKAIEAAEKLRDFRRDILEEEQDYIEMKSEMKLLKNREATNKLLAQEKDATKRLAIIDAAAKQEELMREQEILNKIMSLNDAEAQIVDEEGNLKVGYKQEEYDAILLARQKLYTELSEIEEKQTSDVIKNSDDQLKARLKSVTDVINQIKEISDLFFQALETINMRQEAQLEEALERSAERQQNLQEEIDNSSGLRRLYFEQQLEREVANAEALEKAKEELAKKAAKQQKAQAILQSIINTALAVTSALGTFPAPNVVAALIAGTLGATQTALIAAQPLAKGGVVGKGQEIVTFASGGRVTSRGNIKPLSNGDNVLATLKTGEVVLNENQQRRIGYQTLKAAQIPNFASGGLVGAPTAFVNDQISALNDEKSSFNMMQKMIIETQSRIDRIQVVYTADTEDSVDKARQERKQIRTTAEF
jgi:hypothetical protein